MSVQPLADNYVGNGGYIQPERCHSSSSSSSEQRQATAAAVAATAVDIAPSPSAAPEERASTPFHRLCTLCLLLSIFYSAISAAASSCLFPTITLVDFLALMHRRLDVPGVNPFHKKKEDLLRMQQMGSL